jgi:hypothetical protein
MAFRKRCTCTTILESMHDWCLNLQSHISTDAVYLDSKKAFDSDEAHPKLLIKLPAYGINGNLHTWLSDFLHNRLQVVKMNKTYSHTIKVTIAVFRKVVF